MTPGKYRVLNQHVLQRLEMADQMLERIEQELEAESEDTEETPQIMMAQARGNPKVMKIDVDDGPSPTIISSSSVGVGPPDIHAQRVAVKAAIEAVRGPEGSP